MNPGDPHQQHSAAVLPADHPALQSAPPRGSDPDRPSPELLLWTYAHGVFPMADPDSRRKGGTIDWFCPDPRGIFPLHPPEAFHVPRNLGREVRRKKFEIRCDTSFEQVMRSCANARSLENPSWINEHLIQAYTQLHRWGHAH